MSYITKIMNRGYLNWLPDSVYLKMRYYDRMGQHLHLERPITFSEKLQWLKLYDRKPIYSIMVDKYAVKRYVAEKIGDKYIIPNVTEKMWKRYEEIDFSHLPERFVLKCSHDSGGLVICTDKRTLNHEWAKRKLNTSMKNNYYLSNREWPYKNVELIIFAEEYQNMENAGGMIDYKFYCFNGEPQFLYVSQGLIDHKTAKMDFLSLDWKPMPFYREDYARFSDGELPSKPKTFSEMIDVARMLSALIPFVRVDLYEIEGQVKFSELTFSPCGGFMKFCPNEWDEKIGAMLILPKRKE